MYHNGGQRMQYDVLREFACRDDAEPVRLNAYVTYDVDRAGRDNAYRDGATAFHSKLRDYGYKVIVKEVKWFTEEGGQRMGKANADLDLAVDALLQSEKLDRVLIASGDGDFVQVVRALQNRGCRVEIVGLDNTSYELRQEADLFISGFLIPNMIPMLRGDREKVWARWARGSAAGATGTRTSAASATCATWSGSLRACGSPTPATPSRRGPPPTSTTRRCPT